MRLSSPTAQARSDAPTGGVGGLHLRFGRRPRGHAEHVPLADAAGCEPLCLGHSAGAAWG